MSARLLRPKGGKREGEEKGGRENFLQQLPFSLFFSWVSWVDGVRRRMCESQSELIWHGMGGATEGEEENERAPPPTSSSSLSSSFLSPRTEPNRRQVNIVCKIYNHKQKRSGRGERGGAEEREL